MDGGSPVIYDEASPKTETNQGKADESMAQMEGKIQLSVTQFLTSISSLLKLKQPQKAVEQCNEALALYPGNSKLLEKKTKVLCQQHQFKEAYKLVEEWLRIDPRNSAAKREQQTLKIILSAVEDRESNDDEEEEVREDDDESEGTSENEDQESSASGADSINDPGMSAFDALAFGPYSKSAFQLVDRNSTEQKKKEGISGVLPPSFSPYKPDLDTQDTQLWLYRDPPRGLASDQYGMCKRYLETGRCTFGEKCTMAHSEAELDEWNHRYAVRKQQLQQSHGAFSQGGTVIDHLMEKFMSQEHPKVVVVENMDLVKIHVNSDLKVNMTTKKCTNAWTFTVTSKLCLHCVALMSDTNRSYFHISSISVGPRKTQKYQNLESFCQEWVNQDTQGKAQGEYVYRVKVVFKTDIYGTFRQSIVFDFGVDAMLMREVQVESAPSCDAEKVRKEITLTEAHRWNEKTVQLVNFDPRPSSQGEAEEALIVKYTLPGPDKFCQPETVMQSLSRDNYRRWMHEMLYIEEMEQVRYISRFNVTTSVQLVDRFLLLPSMLSTAKYAHNGELFARMKLEDDLSEDSMGGRLVLQSSHVAWVASAKKERPDKVYEALIEDKGKNFIFMRLSKTCVDELGLTCDQDFNAKIQFQLNRLPMCERHSAVDRLPSLDIVFPRLGSMPEKLSLDDDSVLQDPKESKRLNEKQKDAVRLILAKTEQKLPPLLIVGPFGTGKTFTMAQAAKQVLKQEGTRILICTHSNSAADLYIKEFLHSYVDEEDHAEARPLRVMYKFRWIQTVPEVVLDYTLLEREGPQAGTFRPPTKDDVLAHRVIIATLSSARSVVDLDLPKDTFSHIFIDEAAQSLECETLIPLAVAHEGTRIVFAGDHMQMSPEVYSDFTRQQGFHTSLLERLHELYPKECVYKVMLCENYRAHAAIIDFTSELFYDNKLICSGNIIAHDEFYPLTFYAAKGEETQHENNTGFYNMSEVYEIVERVDELKKKWPEAWGSFEDNGVSIVAPYIDQVARIRSELRKRKLYNINVERVLNVQGKQYRVILLSITRTRLTCRSDPSVEEYLDFGFLSNIKLLNTAITRAQSLVVVVGDPVSVCLVGKCRKIWEYFLELCHHHDSLHGISWVPLREQLDRAELTKSFVLNPLAPEFVPSRLYSSPHTTQLSVATDAHALGQPVGVSSQHSHHHPHYHQHHFAGGYAPGYPAVIPGQPFPQMLPPVYMPYAPSLMPTMYYPPGGLQRNLFGRPMSLPPGASPYMGPRVVGNARHPRGGSRQNMYYQRGAPVGIPPHGYHPHYHPQPPLLQQPPGYFYHLPPAEPFPPHPYVPLRFPTASAYGAMPPRGQPGYPHHGNFHASHHVTGSPLMTLFKGPSNIVRERSDTADSSGSGGRWQDSPSPGIQLLPNVKHAPAHLLDRSSNPSQARLTSNRPYSPANYAASTRGQSEEDVSSRDRSLSISPPTTSSAVSQAQAISNSSIAATLEKESKATSNGNDQNGTASTEETTTGSGRKKPSLKLRTGFSRQFSDDLPTPTVITNVFQMIDDNFDEPVHEEDDEEEEGNGTTSSSSSPSPALQRGGRPELKLKMTVAQRLQLRQATDDSQDLSSSSATPPSGGDPAPSLHLDLQTPRTPKGFVTPGTEMGEVDPFGILKSLNIGNVHQ